MRNNRTFLLVGIGLLVLVLVVWLISLQPKKYVWSETFNNENSQPYDLSLFKSVLEASVPEGDFNVIRDLYTDTSFVNETGATMFYVADMAYFDSLQVSRLKQFMENGNTLVLSASNQHLLLEKILSDCISEEVPLVAYKEADTITSRLMGYQPESDLNLSFHVREKTRPYPWAYYKSSICRSENLGTLGTFEAGDSIYVDYLRIRTGEGELLAHATPLIFTNFHFKRPEVYAHINQIISGLTEGKILYLDPEAYVQDFHNQPMLSESPLRFILGNEALRWAWYTMIVLALIYVLNTMRRSQKSIPVLASPVNETALYLEVISRLYQKDGRHKHLVGVKEKMILHHLRDKYRLSVGKLDEAFFREASIRLQMDKDYLQNLFKELDRAKNNSTLSDEELQNIEQRITEFYQKCP